MSRSALVESATETALNAGTVTGRPLRAVIYARVSSDPREQLRSVSQQIEECKAECARRGWIIAEIVPENDRSASRYATKDRPKYRLLIEKLRSGTVDVLVTWESSRAQRDLEAYVKLRNVAEESGVQWCYKGRLYDLSRTDDRFTTGLDALLDEREVSVTRDRILRDKRAHAVKGGPHGRLLFGYRREYDPDTGDLLRQVPDEKRARIVREAVRRVASGEALRTIAYDFNQRGILTAAGKLWTPSKISRMVTNPGYVGKRVHQGKVIGDAAWPSLFKDKTAYYACAQRLRAPGRAYHRDGRVRHLLTGIGMCGVCGGTLAFINSENRASYACRGTDTSPTAKCVVMRGTRLDEYVSALVTERLARPDAAELLADQQQAEEAQEAMTEAAEKRARLDEFYDAAANGEVTAAAVARIEARLLPEIEAAERRAASVRVAPVLRDVVRPDIADVWPTLAIGQRREVIRTLMDITLLPHQPGSRNDPSLRVVIDWRNDL